MKKRILHSIAVLLFSSALLGAVTVEDGQRLLGVIDKTSNFSGMDLAAVMTMVTEDPEKGIERTVVQQFRNDDEEKFLMLIKEPSIKKGQGYLMVEDNLWFYDPESRNFSHTSLKDQFSNSDANNSDFNASAMEKDYRVVSIKEGRLGKYDVYTLEIEANNNEVTYPKQKIWVTVQGTLVLKTEDYSAGGRLMRTSYYPSYARAGKNVIPTKMIFVDELIAGKKTTITIQDISVDKLPTSIFTKSYVERVNR
ncbi:MAG: outer membrane lipoprotein-sorting protein [Spirochaetales bacterium]|jgi:outer membrane lipoprotein-sorting protein|nr:outer membrane lipoprotein-sorting protein [Spirochaetales bacterium]